MRESSFRRNAKKTRHFAHRRIEKHVRSQSRNSARRDDRSLYTHRHTPFALTNLTFRTCIETPASRRTIANGALARGRYVTRDERRRVGAHGMQRGLRKRFSLDRRASCIDHVIDVANRGPKSVRSCGSRKCERRERNGNVSSDGANIFENAFVREQPRIAAQRTRVRGVIV